MSSVPPALIAKAFRNDRTVPQNMPAVAGESLAIPAVVAAVLCPGVAWFGGIPIGLNLLSTTPGIMIVLSISLFFLALAGIALVSDRRWLKRQELRYHLYTTYPEQVKQYVKLNIELDDLEQRVQHSKQVMASL